MFKWLKMPHELKNAEIGLCKALSMIKKHYLSAKKSLFINKTA